MQIDRAVPIAGEKASLVEAHGRRVQCNTRSTEPEWPCAVECPDGCGALVWLAGNEQGRTILLDTFPVASGSGGYVVEPLYVGPAADIERFEAKNGTAESSAREFVEQANAWNWYATYESTLVTSSNSRFGLHVATCARKSNKQRARALNGQTYGGCCRAKAERNAAEKSATNRGVRIESVAQRASIAAPNGQLYLFPFDQQSRTPKLLRY